MPECFVECGMLGIPHRSCRKSPARTSAAGGVSPFFWTGLLDMCTRSAHQRHTYRFIYRVLTQHERFHEIYAHVLSKGPLIVACRDKIVFMYGASAQSSFMCQVGRQLKNITRTEYEGGLHTHVASRRRPPRSPRHPHYARALSPSLSPSSVFHDQERLLVSRQLSAATG